MPTPTTPFQLTDQFNMANFNEKIADTNTYIQEMVAAAQAAGAKIQTGSYVGTGTYGQANPCSLTFDFAPKLIFLMSYLRNGDRYNLFPYADGWITVMYAPNLTIGFSDYNSAGFGYRSNLGICYGAKSADSKTISWYFDGSTGDVSFNQANKEAYVYSYVAIG